MPGLHEIGKTPVGREEFTISVISASSRLIHDLSNLAGKRVKNV